MTKRKEGAKPKGSPITEAQKQHIRQYAGSKSIKDMSIELGISRAVIRGVWV